MISVSVAIMAHPARKRFVPELVAKLDRAPTVVWDECNNRWCTGRRSMLAYDPEATHHLVVQDDAIVCRDLVAGVEKALAQVPGDVPLSLYAGRVRPFRNAVETLVARATVRTSWLTMAGLHWGVGIVMPTKFIDDMIVWGDGRPDIENYDKRIGRWLAEQRITVYYPWPSLVDHRNSPSLVPGRRSAGRYAYKFVGEHVSALELDYAGEVVSIPPLNRFESEPRQRPNLASAQRRIARERQRERDQARAAAEAERRARRARKSVAE